MPNNTDISNTLNQEMNLDRALHDGKSLYTLPVFATGEDDLKYLYRSMSLEEARNWFKVDWLPDASGIPWSTNWKYSRDKYLKDDSVVQLEVPAHDVLTRIKTVGAEPKYEGAGQTWGVGPFAEVGRRADKVANKALQSLYTEYETKLPQELQNMSKGAIINTKNARTLKKTGARAPPLTCWGLRPQTPQL